MTILSYVNPEYLKLLEQVADKASDLIMTGQGNEHCSDASEYVVEGDTFRELERLLMFLENIKQSAEETSTIQGDRN